ncbi:MAG: hypothetical protein HUJ30_00690 [Gammaproteobacteria bacterium]|nr:hypothetical protein [Gammaproteobacteria bacterium]
MWEIIYFIIGCVYTIIGVLLGAWLDDRMGNCVTRCITNESKAYLVLFFWPPFFFYCYVSWQVNEWAGLHKKQGKNYGEL